MSFEPGQYIIMYKWIAPPVPSLVIDKMHELADKYTLKNRYTNIELNLIMMTCLKLKTQISMQTVNSMVPQIIHWIITT